MIKLTKQQKEILKKYPTYSQDGKGENAEAILKFFNPAGAGTWYVLDAEPIHDNPNDYLFFGYVESPLGKDFNEYGYFLLSELSELKVPMYIKEEDYEHFLGYGYIEVDKTFTSKKMGQILEA